MTGDSERKIIQQFMAWLQRGRKQKEKQKEEDWNRSRSHLALDSVAQYSVNISTENMATERKCSNTSWNESHLF